MVRANPAIMVPEPGFPELLAAGDTAGARRSLARMDSAMAPSVNQTRFARAGGEYLWSATYHVALRDTAGAEKQLAEIERVLEYRPFQYSLGLLFSDPQPWMGQAWSLGRSRGSAGKAGGSCAHVSPRHRIVGRR